MDSLPLCTTGTTSTTNSFSTELSLPSLLQSRISRNLSFAKKPRKFLVFASKDEPPKLDQWDQMELKFGKMLGEDPKLTLAKIMARKSNPDMSYLEIEKSFQKKKGKGLANEIEELPFDVSGERKSANSSNGLNLVRPVPKKGVKFQSNEKSVEKEDERPNKPVTKAVDNSQGSVPNVILRKPSLFNDDGNEAYSRFNIRPNLALKMGKEQQKESFSDITLLKKPEPLNTNPNLDRENGTSGDSPAEFNYETGEENMKTITLMGKPELANPGSHNDQERDNLDQSPESRKIEAWEGNESVAGLQPRDISSSEENFSLNAPSATQSSESSSGIHADTALIGKPKRLDQSVKEKANLGGEKLAAVNNKSRDNGLELQNFLSSPIKEHEENDWTRAEDLVKSGERADVEVISSSTRGFAVSFGSLIGFLPYRHLAAKWKFLAFESWLRRRSIDPSKYKQSLGVIGSFDSAGVVPTTEARLDPKFDGEISSDMKLEDLLRIYDQEKLKFLSSFVGQKIKVMVVLADRRSRRLIFSIKPKEKEELIVKKRNLMRKLSVGDVVKCCIKKITYFGIFAEVEEVPALIHQTEVSWDATLDPAAFFKVGQIVEAKVHQLDFSLDRIFLSLKEVMPDPLVEALEAVVGDHDSLNGRLEAAQADTEWAEVESLIKELEQVEGIQSVSKGRYFLSPGLAPTFQVYMALMFENQYKLLARSGNRAQEVIVQTSLGKEEIKSAILTCTNRVQ